MQQLQVLRHAKAVPWSPDREDFPRKLSAAGIQHARNVAGWIVDQIELPDHILCSPSQRTRETLAPLLSKQPELEAVTHFIPQIYHSDRTTLETLLDAAFSEFDRVMIVGHNPGLEWLVGDVIHPSHYEQFTRLPTGTLAVVNFEKGWAEGQGRGRLLHLVRGKKLSTD